MGCMSNFANRAASSAQLVSNINVVSPSTPLARDLLRPTSIPGITDFGVRVGYKF